MEWAPGWHRFQNKEFLSKEWNECSNTTQSSYSINNFKLLICKRLSGHCNDGLMSGSINCNSQQKLSVWHFLAKLFCFYITKWLTYICLIILLYFGSGVTQSFNLRKMKIPTTKVMKGWNSLVVLFVLI